MIISEHTICVSRGNVNREIHTNKYYDMGENIKISNYFRQHITVVAEHYNTVQHISHI